jgi:hypothetical protein
MLKKQTARLSCSMKYFYLFFQHEILTHNARPRRAATIGKKPRKSVKSA